MTENDPHLTNGLVPGILTGLVAMLVGAAAYGALIGFTEFESGFAAIGVGVLVGLAMMAVKPTSPVLPPLAAFFSLAGVVLGQIAGYTLRLVREIGGDYGTAVREVLAIFPDALKEEPISLLFWVIAAYAGFSFVNKRVTSAREALAASSVPQPDKADHVDNFTPKKQP